MASWKEKHYRSSSEEETFFLGKVLGESISQGRCISLVGPLGAGKTVLARGICRGLGVEEEILSPTFVLCEEFAGKLPVLHVDLYRLEHERELEALGIFDRIGTECVVIVEWGDRSDRLTSAADMIVELRMRGESGRDVTVRERIE
jgi:tRNA threonylcarbamoyladenosine biosynthesis protein TsaE